MNSCVKYVRHYAVQETGHLSYNCPHNKLGDREPPPKKDKKKKKGTKDER
jgi:U11/U12 small nuclear ribonucleoprotein 31 kDa protein